MKKGQAFFGIATAGAIGMAYLGSLTSTVLSSLRWVGRVHRESCAGVSGKGVVAVTRGMWIFWIKSPEDKSRRDHAYRTDNQRGWLEAGEGRVFLVRV